MNFVVFVNGLVLLLMAALMGVVAFLYSGTREVFLTSFVLVGLPGAFISLASSTSFHGLHRLHGFLLTGSVWLTAALAGAMPLYLWSLSPMDALFEAVSGITTTGSTIMVGLDTTPKGVLLWRALLQAVGGVGFIVTGIALLPILKVGGMQLFRTESSDKGEMELSNAARFATATLLIYLALITVCFCVYRIGGMGSFDAITHAMTTLSTGGYSNYDASFGQFESNFLEWAATFFMLFGALPFAWYIRILWRGALRSEQVTGLLAGLGVVIVVITVWRVATSDASFSDALRQVAFNVTSVVTTTGYATTDYTSWGAFATAAFFILTAIGGCTGSTSGGVKIMRWIVLARCVSSQLRKVHHPHGVFVTRYEKRVLSEDVLSGVISFFGFYFTTFMALALTLNFLGLDFTTAVSGALTSLANVGPGVGTVIGPAGNFAPLNDASKLVLTVGMYLGRLEMLTIFVMLTPTFWRAA